MLSQLLRFIHLLEDTLLITLLVSMMVLASGQIILRNFFDQGFLWIDPLLRVLVLEVLAEAARLALDLLGVADVDAQAEGPRVPPNQD